MRVTIWKCILVVSAAALTHRASAALTFDLGHVYNGAAPGSPDPWLTAKFEDVAGGVRLTLTSSLEDSSEFIRDVAFNVKPTVVPSSITILDQNSQDPKAVQISATGQNRQSVVGGGNQGMGFDFEIAWSTANNRKKRFDGTDVDTFLLTRPGGLEASDFNFANADGLMIAAHIQGISVGGSGSIASLPEPSTYFAGLGALGLRGYLAWRGRNGVPAS